MNTDKLFEQATPKKQVETTIYEVNDSASHKKHEYGKGSGDVYFKSFVEFIESLGYEVKQQLHSKSNITINNVQFGVDTNNASFMSKNVWKREVNERKPENRFIALEKHKGVIKIFINKVMDAGKLRNSIDKAIQDDLDREQSFKDRDERDEANTVAIGKHYLDNDEIRRVVNYIKIEKGTITFMTDPAQIIFSSDNKFVEVIFYQQKLQSKDDLSDYTGFFHIKVLAIEHLITKIAALPSISKDLIEWCADQHHRTFYSKSMSTNWNAPEIPNGIQ